MLPTFWNGKSIPEAGRTLQTRAKVLESSVATMHQLASEF
jgi:hypothetical protein